MNFSSNSSSGIDILPEFAMFLIFIGTGTKREKGASIMDPCSGRVGFAIPI